MTILAGTQLLATFRVENDTPLMNIWLSGHRRSAMKDKDREHWMELCEQASNEPDPERLLQLVQQINAELEEKDTRVKIEPRP
jgi:hypothetical protein